MSGTPVTIMGTPAITPDPADSMLLWDASAGLTGRATLAVMGGSIFATLGANAFAGSQTIAGEVTLSGYDNGAGEGRKVLIDRNSNVTTGAPGVIILRPGASSFRWLYADNSGVLRIHTTTVTSGEILNGTVVGSQTSSLDTKDVEEEITPIADVIAAIQLAAQDGVKRFRYKGPVEYPMEVDESGNIIIDYNSPYEGQRPYGGETFEGVIVDYAPRYGQDRDDAHPAGKTLNEIVAIGDLLRAVAWLVEQNDALAARVVALEGDWDRIT